MNTEPFSVVVVEDATANVKKLVFTKQDAIAETVLYKYPDYGTRTVICFSVQSGCPIGCRFCGAGNAFVRSLTEDEIIEQITVALRLTGVDPNIIGRLQLMSMSMGEPMLNLKNLVPAIRKLHEKYPNAALLVSTSAPDIGDEKWQDFAQLSVEIKTIGLQFSVHESTDERRSQLIPFKKKLTLAQMAEEGRHWYNATGRKPFFNYCAHDGNSSGEDADRLVEIFKPDLFCATVSVVCEVNDGLPATNEHQRSLAVKFGDELISRGYDVRVFDPAGQDTVGGGCGQLHQVQRWLSQNAGKFKPSVGDGLPVRHAPRKHSSDPS